MTVGCGEMEMQSFFLGWWSTRFAGVFAKNGVQNVVF
jgi:hypothetical protein